MKKILFTLGLALPLFAQPPFDFKALDDKFDPLTEERTKVTLDGDSLRLATHFLGMSDDKDAEALRSLTANLKGVYVRTWEFDREGKYSKADIEPFRAYLKARQWSKIVESQSGKEISEVYIQPLPNDRFGGVAIIDAEPRELTVVYINGAMNLSDLDKLEGNFGIPDVDLNGGKKPPKEKKDDEE